MNFFHMLTKELKELVRSYKVLFVPLVFALLGAGQPIAYHFMPQILKSAGNMPEGMQISMPTYTPGQIMAQVIPQINQLGLLLLILVVMGAIAAERNSGVAATVLAKPVGRGQYLGAKATGYSLLALLSIAAGMAAAGYYTAALVGPVDWTAIAKSTLLYWSSLVLVVAITLSYSAFLPSPVAAGGAALVTVVAVNLVPQYLGRFLASVSPSKVNGAAVALLQGGAATFARPLTGTLVVIALALIGGWLALERQEI